MLGGTLAVVSSPALGGSLASSSEGSLLNRRLYVSRSTTTDHLAHAWRSEQDDVALLFDEAERGQLGDQLAVK